VSRYLRLAELCKLAREYEKVYKAAVAGLMIEGHDYRRGETSHNLELILAVCGFRVP